MLARDAIRRGRYVIIFVEYYGTSGALMHELSDLNPRLITGDTDMAVRSKTTHDFQYGLFNLVILHIGAGGTGLSMHDLVGGKSRTVLVLPVWGGIPFEQVLGRADRLCKMSDVEQIVVYSKSANQSETSLDQHLAAVMSQKLRNIKELDMGEGADVFMQKLYAEATKKITTGQTSPSHARVTINVGPSHEAADAERDPVCKATPSWPLDGIKTIAFDVDGTIVFGNVCESYRPSLFAFSLIRYLQYNGYLVDVASFGNKIVIEKIFGGLDMSVSVYTPQTAGWGDCRQPPPGKSKNNLLALIAQATDSDPSEVLLVDDSLDNVRNAITGGYKALYVENGPITESHFQLGDRKLDGSLTLEQFPSIWSKWRYQDGYWQHHS